MPLCRPLRRHARTAAAIGLIESVLRAYCEHSLGSTVEFTASPCRELHMDESVMVSSVSGRTAVLDCCFAIGMRGRSVCACLLMRCSRARPGLVESTHRSNQTSVSGPGATSGACAAEVQLQDAWAMDDARGCDGGDEPRGARRAQEVAALTYGLFFGRFSSPKSKSDRRRFRRRTISGGDLRSPPSQPFLLVCTRVRVAPRRWDVTERAACQEDRQNRT